MGAFLSIQIFTFHDFPSPSSLTGSILVVISVLAKGGEDHLKPILAECLPILSEKPYNQTDLKLRDAYAFKKNFVNPLKMSLGIKLDFQIKKVKLN